MKKITKKLMGLILICTMIVSMTACGKKSEVVKDTATDTQSDVATTETVAADTTEATAEEVSTEPVTIKVFSNLPDRTTGQGFLEQQIIDSYMAANPNVTIEVEALQDEAYKTKFTAYTASNNLPDVVSVWGQPAFIDPVINSGYLAELNADDYANYNFVEGSMNGFSKDGKIYGLPRNTDIFGIFYNKQIFADNGLTVPTTMDELYAITDKLNAANITPCSMDGQDKWPIACAYTDFVMKTTGDNTLLAKAVSTGDFSDPGLKKAADEMKILMDKKFFQTSFLSADYGAARNLFAQGKAAMFYMGSWEMSMATDEAIDESVRSQIGVFGLPITNGSTAKATDLAAWNGGGHAVSANSPVKEEAIKFLNYMYAPENWAKGAWQNGICIPAQTFDEFLTGKETEVQLAFVDMFAKATSISGTPINDLGTPTFKTMSEDLSQEFAAGMVDADGFLKGIGDALK